MNWAGGKWTETIIEYKNYNKLQGTMILCKGFDKQFKALNHGEAPATGVHDCATLPRKPVVHAACCLTHITGASC